MVDFSGPNRGTSGERREARRVPIALTVRFLRGGLQAGQAVTAELLDVSTKGLRLISGDPLLVGESLVAEIRDDNKHFCNLSARVVWVEPRDDGQSAIGCELRSELTRRQIELFRGLIPAHH